MVYYLRDLAFVDFVYGRSAAVAVVLFAIILALTLLLQFRVQRQWVHYGYSLYRERSAASRQAWRRLKTYQPR